VEFEQAGAELTGTMLGTGTTPYPADLRDRLVAAFPPAATDLAEVCALDTLVGQHFAEAAAGALAAAGTEVDLVVSHGQTVFHWVEGGRARGTLQLGQPAWIAERTGTPVLSDLRSADVAAGGQGAPLVCVLDRLLLSHLPGTTVALNLGGIANLTVLQGSTEPVAYDLGPANALIDDAITRATGGATTFDIDGSMAAFATVDRGLLEDLLAEPYYELPAPKSTGKELFHAGYLEAHLARHPGIAPDDVVATVTALTAEVVAREVRRVGAGTVVASGGGVRNRTLMDWVAERLPAVMLRTSDEFGAPSDAKEAIAFALIGYLSAHGIPANVPSCTGASGPRVLGTVTAGALGARELVATPERLVLR